MKPSRPERRAQELLAEYEVNDVPIPVEALALALGTEVSLEPFEGDISGMLYRYPNGSAMIGINANDPSERQRFTVAHEIGHFLLHTGRPMIIDRFVHVNMRNGTATFEEGEANRFAAELLMPREHVYDEVQRVLAEGDVHRDSGRLVRTLAEVFDVSAEAMRFRLSNLGVLSPG